MREADNRDSELFAHLSNLSVFLRLRSEHRGDAADLDTAIETGQRATELIPPAHPALTAIQLNLGMSLQARFERTRDTEDLDAAIGCWRRASEIPAGAPTARLTAARMWGEAAARTERKREAAEGYATAVHLLPTVAWHGLGRATRQEHLGYWAGLTSDAAACAIPDSRPERAIELLEQGRSVLWTQALNLRGDLTRLSATAPDLAGRLSTIRRQLDTAVPETLPLEKLA